MYTRCRQRVSQIAKTKKQHLNPFPKQLKKSRWSQQSFDLENMVQTLKTRRQIENLKYTFLFFLFLSQFNCPWGRSNDFLPQMPTKLWVKIYEMEIIKLSS